MRELLSANFARLFRNKVFWILFLITVGLSAYLCIANYSVEIQQMEYRVYLDDVFFRFDYFLGFIIASEVSLIIGSEYSDGTIRNKLVVGHTRASIYFSNLLTSIFATVFFFVSGVLVSGIVGFFLFGALQMPMKQAVFVLICLCLAAVVYTCICILIAMNCANKATAAVISLMLVFGIMYLGSYFGAVLLETKMTYDHMIVTADGIQYGNLIRNPAYVDGVKRTIYTFCCDLLPSGQMYQIDCMDVTHASRWPWYSLGLSIATTLAGFAAFTRKNIK